MMTYLKSFCVLLYDVCKTKTTNALVLADSYWWIKGSAQMTANDNQNFSPQISRHVDPLPIFNGCTPTSITIPWKKKIVKKIYAEFLKCHKQQSLLKGSAQLTAIDRASVPDYLLGVWSALCNYTISLTVVMLVLYDRFWYKNKISVN